MAGLFPPRESPPWLAPQGLGSVAAQVLRGAPPPSSVGASQDVLCLLHPMQAEADAGMTRSYELPK